MSNTAVGAGMGTSGLVGQFSAFAAVPDGGATLLIQVVLMHFILPAILTLIIHEITIKLGWVKSEYLKLEAL